MNINEIDLWWYRARVYRVVDGDTIIFDIDKGMHDVSRESIRINGIDTAELFTGNEREQGAAAKEFTEHWIVLKNGDPKSLWDPEFSDEWQFMIRTSKDKQSFARYVADVYATCDGESLADAVIEAGFSEDLR